MKFTVFGATGFIGTHLVSHLRLLGYDVSAVSRSNFSEKRGDLGHCIYAFGLTSDFRSRPFETIEAHVCIASDLLRNADFQSFLYLSSTRVYANSNEAQEETALCVSPSSPSDLYNLSKLTGEAICLSSGRKNVRIARLSNVIGPDEAGSETFVGELCREALRGHIQLRTDPRSSKDYIWINDVTRLLAQIAQKGRHSIYNVASGIQLSHQAWISGISALTGCSVAVEVNAPVISFPDISTERIASEFGATPCSVLTFLPMILSQKSVSQIT
ncbi:SDR family oxidoreductase [Agrobacterium rosae]|uniref:SDR family oxidoreductase n=1 Tax=Agrobacterium rosae TaxID=1972867 RepID=A0ABU4W5K0_9HYPH|nr:SDR family oxidoreductase [Agrobacterium rosae]MDX8333064.1 SDR family oxidoreductase [Agrobacterium rosae]